MRVDALEPVLLRFRRYEGRRHDDGPQGPSIAACTAMDVLSNSKGLPGNGTPLAALQIVQ